MRIEDEIKSTFQNDQQKLVVNLKLTSSRVGEDFDQALKNNELTNTQFNVLRILRGQNGNPICIGLIKERMIERNSDVSRIIDRLYKKELINRKENPGDRRLKDVIISEKGLVLLKKIDLLFENFYQQEFSHLDKKEIQLLNDLLDKVRSKNK